MELGVQTYTIRNLAKKNISMAFALLLKKGIRKVELSRIKPNQFNAQVIHQHNIRVLALQLPYGKLKQVSKIAQFCDAVGCQRVVVSVLPTIYILSKPQTMKRFATKMNQLALAYEKHHISVGFHHHDFDLKRFGHQNKLEILLKYTSERVGFVIDTYWMTKMKEPIIPWITRLEKRLMGIHLRDHKRIESGRSKDTEIGSGDVDFESIMKVAKPYNPYLVIEQNSRNPMHSIDMSLNHLQKHIRKEYEL